MKHTKIKGLTDGAVCTALTVLFLVMAVYLPPFALAAVMVAGTPLVYLGVRHGTKISGVAWLASVLVFGILTGDFLTALLMGAVNLLPGLVIGYAIPRRATFNTVLLAASGAVLFGLLLELLLLNASGGGNGIETLLNGALDQMGQMMDAVLAGLNTGEVNLDSIAPVLREALEQVRETVFLYLPSFVIGMSALLGYGALMLSIFVLRRLRVRQIVYPAFGRFKASRGFCYGAMLLFLVASFSHDTTVYTAALKNVVALMYAYLGVCGLSLVDYKLSERISSGYVRALLYGVAFLVGYLLLGFLIQALIFLGMLDGLFNFRRLNKVGEDYAKRK